MAGPYTTPQQISATIPPRRIPQVIVMGGASVGVVTVLGALALWFRYGTDGVFRDHRGRHLRLLPGLF
jgi:hypothetical protein